MYIIFTTFYVQRFYVGNNTWYVMDDIIAGVTMITKPPWKQLYVEAERLDLMGNL